MDPITLGIIGLAIALLLIALGVEIAYALGGVAVVGIFILFAFPETGDPRGALAVTPTLSLVNSTIFSMFHSYTLSAIPMFIALGNVCYRAGMTTEIYGAARMWLNRVPGGLAVASLLGCGGFSAISGSSLACAATMGRVCVPEMLKYGYSDKMATGAIAAGGTLGALIPPSIALILYGLFAEQSISLLFIAAVIPGLLTLVGYIMVVVIWAVINPKDVGVSTERFTWDETIRATLSTWPVVLIFAMIFGGIYGGIFTSTEAGAASFIFAVLVSVVRRKLDWRGLILAMRETVVQTAVIMLVAAGASLFVRFVALSGMADGLAVFVQDANFSPFMLITVIIIIYLLMGMILDPMGILLLTLPFMLPLVEVAGFNMIWFGILVVKLIEMGLITPPVGLNVFVLSTAIDKSVPIARIFQGTTFFFLSDLVVLVIIAAFPILSLFLPMAMSG